jgi:outer membrane receptor for ferrienterochelin and colicins
MDTRSAVAARTARWPRKTALSVMIFAHLVAPVFAQDADNAVTMDEVVVTASGFEQKITDAPASISVISRTELEKRPYTSLNDALRDIEGIDVGLEATDKNGMATVSMRGMPSGYTLVLIDGRRQSNVGNIYPNNFGGGQFSFMPPLASIERIEVVRGPMSTLYGSDAMGGVINIITRKVADGWHGSLSHGRGYQENDQFGDSNQTDVYLAGPLIPGKLGLSVRGGRYHSDASNPEWETLTLPDGTPWDRALGFGGGGKQVANTNWNSGLRLSFTPNENHDFMLDYDISRQKFDNSEGQTGTLDSVESLWRSGNATIPNPNFDPSQPISSTNPETITRRVVQPRVGYTEYQRYERDQLALTHVGRWDFGTSTTSVMQAKTNNLGRSLPLTIAEREDLQDLWNDVCARRGQAEYCNNGAISVLTPTELARLESFLPRALRTLELEGVVVDSKLELPIGRHVFTVGGQYNDTDMTDGVFGMDGAGYIDGASQKHKQWALFAEDNWNFVDSLTATYGLRYDDHNVFGDHLSPRGYLVWTANERWTVKGGVSTGYKAPEPNQLFPGVTGFGGQGVIPLVGNPGLKPETSTSTELAVYYDNGSNFNLNATLFFNKFDDKIATGDSIPNCAVAAAGVACADVGPGWAELGYRTFSQSINIDRAETRGVEIAARWQISDAVTLRGNYTYTESEQKSGVERGLPITGNPAKHMVNTTLDWQATDTLNLALIAESRSKRYRDFNTITEQGRYYDGYEIFHLGASWKPERWEGLSINGRVNNLFDKNFIAQTCELSALGDAFDCLDNYSIKDKRRSYWLSAKVEF